MTVLKKFQQISAKTKILLFSLILIILPSGFLGYLGYKSIEDRELHLKDNYIRLTRLLRDQLEGKLGSLEGDFIRDMEAYDWSPDVPEIQSQLRQIQKQFPVVGKIFLVDSLGAIIHPDVLLVGPSSMQSGSAASQALSSTFVATGERHEFVENDYSQALASYKRALDQTSSIHVQTYTRMLIARCHFKMNNYPQAVENYGRLAETNVDVRSTDGTPLKIIGLSQLAESFSRLGQNQDHHRSLLHLYKELISTPFGFDSYDFYLQTVKEELTRLSQESDWDNEYRIQWDKLKGEETKQLQAVRYLELSKRTVMEQINTESSFSREIIQDEEGKFFQFACVTLSS